MFINSSSLKSFGDLLADKNLLHEPAYYSIIWTFVGIMFLIATTIIIIMIFYSTRKKSINSLSNLRLASPQVIDIAGLRNKYLGLIQDTENRFNSRQIKASVAHQELSILVRLFYAEASGFHAEFLTLNDLKRSTKQHLTKAIELYYPNEFDQLEKGSVSTSAQLAKELIMNDEAINNAVPIANNVSMEENKS